jgi:malate/lactate dehydrogenase
MRWPAALARRVAGTSTKPTMSFIAILGAGTLGGTLAHKLAGRDLVRGVRLIDPTLGVAAGKALDIQQAGPVERFDTRVTAAGEVDAVIGATAVVVAGPADTPEEDWQGEAALALLNQVAGLTRRIPIVCAGASQGTLVANGVRQLGIDRKRIFGSAPGALVSGLRAIVALEAGVSPGQVAINLLGVPPAHAVVTWSSATIGGYPLEHTLSSPQLARLRDRVEHLWPPGPIVLASAAARVVEALVAGGARRTFACFVDEGTGEGPSARSVGVTLGPDGIEEILPATLSRLEQVGLENARGSPDGC